MFLQGPSGQILPTLVDMVRERWQLDDSSDDAAASKRHGLAAEHDRTGASGSDESEA
jgi:hypothetical protein